MNKLWEPLDHANKLNPYPMYKALRDYEPVHKSQTGEWILTGYEDIRRVLTDKSFKSGNRKNWLDRGVAYLNNKDIDIKYISEAINSFVLQLDPPAHTRIRRFISDNWSKDGINEIIESNTKKLLVNLPNGHVDVVKEFTSKLPSLNTTAIMGLPREDYQRLHELSSEMIKALDLYVNLKDLVRLNEASREFVNYFKSKISVTSHNVGLISTLLEANKKYAEPLTDEELTSILIFLFVASEETTVSFISMSIYLILKNGLHDSFKNNAFIGKHLEELIRYESPVQLLGRIASRDCIIGSHNISKGDTITLCIGAANRDEEVFPNPDIIQLDRNPRHLSFGKGTHYCLGDWLAKSTAECAIPLFLNQFNDISVISEPHDWYDNIAIRGFKSLMIEIKS